MIKGVAKSSLLARAAAFVPMSAWHSVTGRPLLIPYYHMVTEGPAPHVQHLYRFRTTKQFEADLEFFVRYFEPIRLEDLLDKLDGRGRLPERAFLLTFDDGFREMHDVVMPILLAKGVPAVFFVVSGCVDNCTLCHHQKISVILDHWKKNQAVFPVGKVTRLLDQALIPAGELRQRLLGIRYADRKVLDDVAAFCGCDLKAFLADTQPYLTSDQIRALIKNGFSIGAHSLDHPLYREIPPAEQLRQTRESMQFLCERFGAKPRAFAFPHTDAGVTPAFFELVFKDGTLDVTFGTAGLLRDSRPRHFQRFSLEQTVLPARPIVSRQYARRLLRRAITREVVAP